MAASTALHVWRKYTSNFLLVLRPCRNLRAYREQDSCSYLYRSAYCTLVNDNNDKIEEKKNLDFGSDGNVNDHAAAADENDGMDVRHTSEAGLNSDTYSDYVYRTNQERKNRRRGYRVGQMRAELRKKYSLSDDFKKGTTNVNSSTTTGLTTNSDKDIDSPLLVEEQCVDFFGISSQNSMRNVDAKYPDKCDMKNVSSMHMRQSQGPEKDPNDVNEKVYVAPFGTIRLDKDNKAEMRVQRQQNDTKFNNLNESLMISNADSYPDHSQMSHKRGEGAIMERSHSASRMERHIRGGNSYKYDLDGSQFIDDQYFQYEPTVERSHSTKERHIRPDEHYQEDSQYIDPQHFQHNSNEKADKMATREHHVLLKDSLKSNEQVFSELPYIDQQYFGDIQEGSLGGKFGEVGKLVDKSVADTSKHLGKQGEFNTMILSAGNFFDEQYFPPSGDQQSGDSVKPNKEKNISETPETDFFKQDKKSATDINPTHITHDAQSMHRSSIKTDESETEHIVAGGQTQRAKYLKSRPVANIDNPQTAYDVAMKIRFKEKTEEAGITGQSRSAASRETLGKTRKLDSKGFAILSDQVQKLGHLPEDVVVNILRDSIIYENEQVVAIDKPYGLPSHGGPGIHHSVGKLLPALAAKMERSGNHSNVKMLRLVHRLDKETTGVILLAKDEETAWKLNGMFKRRDVIKKYWVLTKGIPNPTEGVIDIPMSEIEVDGKFRMGLRPDYDETTKVLMKKAKEVTKYQAITNYTVLDSANSCALVECQPETGVKHQIRCHLAFGLNTPILGDHKYSHFSKLAPQRLYPDTLQVLGIRQAKVRHLAMHLHARVLILPQFKNGRNLFLYADLPKHFKQNMKRIKIKPPEK